MASESEPREFLARIYDLLRIQQQALFDLGLKIQALEMTAMSNPQFAERYQESTAEVRTSEVMQKHAQSVAALDELIRQLRGKTPGLN